MQEYWGNNCSQWDFISVRFWTKMQTKIFSIMYVQIWGSSGTGSKELRSNYHLRYSINERAPVISRGSCGEGDWEFRWSFGNMDRFNTNQQLIFQAMVQFKELKFSCIMKSFFVWPKLNFEKSQHSDQMIFFNDTIEHQYLQFDSG